MGRPPGRRRPDAKEHPVPDDSRFNDFLHRVRAGDAAAAEELVRRYESAIRVAVRVRLTDQPSEDVTIYVENGRLHIAGQYTRLCVRQCEPSICPRITPRS